jgi:hypothetical protein
MAGTAPDPTDAIPTMTAQTFSWTRCCGNSPKKVGGANGAAGSWQLEAGNWQLETGSWKRAAGSWQLEAGGWKPEAGSW